MSARAAAAGASTPFDWLSARLLESSSLGERTAGGDARVREMAVRGTVRLALKRAGLPQKGVSSEELRAVIEQVLPELLRSRLVDDAHAICQRLAAEIRLQHFDEGEQEDYLGGFLKRAVR